MEELVALLSSEMSHLELLKVERAFRAKEMA